MTDNVNYNESDITYIQETSGKLSRQSKETLTKLNNSIKGEQTTESPTGNGPSSVPMDFVTDAKQKLPTSDPILTEVALPFMSKNEAVENATDYLGKSKITDEALNLAESVAPGQLKNAIKNISRGEIQQSISGITGVSSFKDLSSLVQAKDGSLTGNFDLVKNRIENSLGMSGGLSSLSNTAKNSILGFSNYLESKGVSKWIVDGTELTGNELTNALNGNSFNSVSSLTKFVNRISSKVGDMGISTDVGALCALIVGVSSQLDNFGISGLVDSIIDKIKDTNTQQLMYEELCIRAAYQGDIVTTKHYADLMGADRRVAISDEVITNLFSTANFRYETNPSYKTLGDNLIEIANLMRPNFDNWDRKFGDIKQPRLVYYTKLNKISYKALARTDRAPLAAAYGYITKKSASIVADDVMFGGSYYGYY